MLGRTPCFAAFPEEAALRRSDNSIRTGSTDPGCPQVLPGILIAKMAIWGFVLAASGQFAKLQIVTGIGDTLDGVRDFGDMGGAVFSCHAARYQEVIRYASRMSRNDFGYKRQSTWRLSPCHEAD